MATAAQVFANQNNAQHSTGPQTGEGKQKSSRNNFQHGLTLGVLTVEVDEQSEFCDFEAKFREDVKPVGIFECEAFQQFLDAAWRLRKCRALVGAMFEENGDDPLLVAGTEAKLKQINRYRAAAEMLAYRAMKSLRELQTARLFRTFHVTPEEQEVLPPLAKPGLKMRLAGELMAHNDREIFYHIHGADPFTSQFASSKPIPCPPGKQPDFSGTVIA